MSILITIVCVTLFTSATCSLFEAVLYAVPTGYVDELASKGSAGKILSRLRSEIDRPIAAILSLNTIANTAGAAVAGAVAIRVLDEGLIIYFSVGFTLLVLLLAEVLPKTAGVTYCRTFAPFVARPLAVLVTIMTPMVWLCALATATLKRGREDQPYVSPDELISMARISHAGGAIDRHEMTMLTNMLQLSRKSARERTTMIENWFLRSPTQTLAEVAEDVARWPHSRVLLCSDGSPQSVVGVVRRSEVLSAVVAGDLSVLLSDLMHPVHLIDEDQPLDVVLHEFLDKRLHLFVVRDAEHVVIGLITLEDVLESLLGKDIRNERVIEAPATSLSAND